MEKFMCITWTLLWPEKLMFLPRRKTQDHLMVPSGSTDFTVETPETMLQVGGRVSGMPVGIPMPLSSPVSFLK
jgi:hypothetical protein